MCCEILDLRNLFEKFPLKNIKNTELFCPKCKIGITQYHEKMAKRPGTRMLPCPEPELRYLKLSKVHQVFRCLALRLRSYNLRLTLILNRGDWGSDTRLETFLVIPLPLQLGLIDPDSTELLDQEERFAKIIKEYELQCRVGAGSSA